MQYIRVAMLAILLMVLLPMAMADDCLPVEIIETYCDDEEDNDCDGKIDANDTNCKIILSDYMVSGGSIDIMQGDTNNLNIMVSNTGSMDLNLSVELVYPEQIKVSAPTRAVLLGLKDSKSINVTVHVPLSSPPGSYQATFKFYGPPDKDGVVMVNVAENAHIGIDLPELEKSIRQYSTQVDEIEKSGVDVSQARERISKATEEIGLARLAITTDDIPALEEHISIAKTIVEADMPANISWLQLAQIMYGSIPVVLGGAILALVVMYIFSRVVIPFTRLKGKIEELERREKEILEARKNAEMQYFRRELDEKTFRNILAQEQKALLDIRTQIRESKTKSNKLFGNKEKTEGLSDFIQKAPNFSKAEETKPFIPATPTKEPKRASQWQKEFQRKIGLVEKSLKHRRGMKRDESEEMLKMSHSYAERDMRAMAVYYLDKAKRALE